MLTKKRLFRKKKVYFTVLIKIVKSIIRFDLLFIEFLFKPIKSIDSKNFSFIELLEFIKLLKQLVRSLQFVKNQRKNSIFIETSEEDYEMFIDCFQEKTLSSKYRIIDRFSSTAEKNSYDAILYIYIRSLVFSKRYFEKLFYRNFLLIFSFSCFFEKNDLGFYKFYTEISEIKNIIFLISILNRLSHKKSSVLRTINEKTFQYRHQNPLFKNQI